MVLDREIKGIKDAFKMYGSGYNPQLTFMIVQKRHHIRLFPVHGPYNDNIQVGTVVDMEITHPNYIDFYLLSHPTGQVKC